MKFHIITIFPHIFDSYFSESILKRAQKKKLVDIRVHDLREYSKEALRHTPGNLSLRRQVDDKPFGGGPGMVMMAEPIVRAIEKIVIKKMKPLMVITSAGGKQFNATHAAKFSKEKQIIIIAGHYEGIDARVWTILKKQGLRVVELSIGPYVLTGGELPAMVMVDAVIRHIPGVLGKGESLEETRFGAGMPTYTRPEVLKWPIRSASPKLQRGEQAHGKQKIYRVPKVLLSGHHKNIAAWRAKHQK